MVFVKDSNFIFEKVYNISYFNKKLLLITFITEIFLFYLIFIVRNKKFSSGKWAIKIKQ